MMIRRVHPHAQVFANDPYQVDHSLNDIKCTIAGGQACSAKIDKGPLTKLARKSRRKKRWFKSSLGIPEFGTSFVTRTIENMIPSPDLLGVVRISVLEATRLAEDQRQDLIFKELEDELTLKPSRFQHVVP